MQLVLKNEILHVERSTQHCKVAYLFLREFLGFDFKQFQEFEILYFSSTCCCAFFLTWEDVLIAWISLMTRSKQFMDV